MPSDDLEILFRDEHMVAINKPSGIFVHRSPMSPPTEPNVMRLLRDQIGQLVTPVHRLDRATSGVLLFALTTDAARELSRQFSEHTVSKQYLAIVRGHTSDEATIDIPLKPHRDGLTGKSSRDQQFPDGRSPRGFWGSAGREEGFARTMGLVRLALS